MRDFVYIYVFGHCITNILITIALNDKVDIATKIIIDEQ